ncbi:unnamed protein product [Rotaria sp. Silwood2]|nr:unnamed protein product [Rotaria sp. Silwood2]
MDNRSKLEYIPGRDLPCYLLDRLNDTFSMSNDGASRIFIETDSCSTIEKNTNTSDAYNTLSNSSLFNLSTADTMSDMLEVSNQNSLQCQSNINMSSIGSEFYESTITQGDIARSSSNISLINTIEQQAAEVTVLTNISLMDTSCNISVCLTKDESQDEHIVFDEYLHSNNSAGPANMFPEYIRRFPDHEDGSKNEKSVKELSASLFHWDMQYV